MLDIPVKFPVYLDACIDAWNRRKHTENTSFNMRDGSVRDPYHRMVVGGTGQYVINDYCKEHNIPVKMIQSEYTRPDDGDLILVGKRTDVKTAEHAPRPQVHAPNKKTEVYVFCWLEWGTPPGQSVLHVMGWLPSKEALAERFFVKKGAKLPGENLRQAFHNGSYFPYPLSVLRPIEDLFYADKRDG